MANKAGNGLRPHGVETYEFHPVAAYYRLLKGAAFDGLVKDIQAHGLRQPIVIHEGKILDGRNRYRACLSLGLKPEFRNWRSANGDTPRAFIQSMNEHRRHDSESQRAMSAARLANLGHGGDRKGENIKTPIGGLMVSQDEAAAEFNVGLRSLQRAKTVLDSGSEALIDAIDEGLFAVSEAASLVREDEEVRQWHLEAARAGMNAEQRRKAVLRKARTRRAAVAARKRLPYKNARYDLQCADFREAKVADGSLDWIITDPPYEESFLPMVKFLAGWARFKLKPGGGLVAMFGSRWLPQVINALASRLEYRWLAYYLLPGGQSSNVHGVTRNQQAKPLLWFSKGPSAKSHIPNDVIQSTRNEGKDAHQWQQSIGGMVNLVECFSEPGQIVCDPFMGGGTTGIACLKTRRLFIGIDLDPNNVAIARERIAPAGR